MTVSIDSGEAGTITLQKKTFGEEEREKKDCDDRWSRKPITLGRWRYLTFNCRVFFLY